MLKKYSLAEILPVAGGVLGLAAGLFIGLSRYGLFLPASEAGAGAQPPTGDTPVGQLAFLLVFVMPFVISLLALRSRRAPVRAVAWIGGGLLALVGAFFSFSALARVLLQLPGVLLLVAGGIAFLRPEVERSLVVVLLALGTVVVGGAAFSTLFIQEDPACWSQVETASGESIWQPSPAGISGPIVLNDPAIGEVIGWTCSSDTISSREGWYSLGIWGLGLLGFWLVRRRGGFL